MKKKEFDLKKILKEKDEDILKHQNEIENPNLKVVMKTRKKAKLLKMKLIYLRK